MLTNFIIDKVRRVTQIDRTSNTVDWTAISIENPQVEFTGESTDKTDAQGTIIARFDTAKGVTFSGEGSMINMQMMAAQLGTEVENASTSNKLLGEIFEVLPVKDSKATMTYKPQADALPSQVYAITADKNVDKAIEVGTDGASVTAAGVITLPNSYKGTYVGVHYTFEVDSGYRVVDDSEKYVDEAKYIVDCYVCDPCNTAVKTVALCVFERAKMDNNFTVNLTTEGTHPFSFTAMKDYCGEGERLCYWLFPESNAENAG